MTRSMHRRLKYMPYGAAAIVLLIAQFLRMNPATPMHFVVLAYVLGVGAILAGGLAAWLAHSARDEERGNG